MSKSIESLDLLSGDAEAYSYTTRIFRSKNISLFSLCWIKENNEAIKNKDKNE